MVLLTAAAAALLLLPVLSDDGREVERFIASLPERSDAYSTSPSRRFKRDIASHCASRCQNLVALELGSYVGETTGVLSRLFRQVFVLEISAKNLAAAKTLNRDRSNIVYMRTDLYSGVQPFGWATALAENDIDVVFIDAAHFYGNVVADVQAVLDHLPLVQTIIFDDYPEDDVHRAVSRYVDAGMLRCSPIGSTLGEMFEAVEPPYANMREGVLCDVLRRGAMPVWHAAILRVHFSCYRAVAAGAPRGTPALYFSFLVNETKLLFFSTN